MVMAMTGQVTTTMSGRSESPVKQTIGIIGRFIHIEIDQIPVIQEITLASAYSMRIVAIVTGCKCTMGSTSAECIVLADHGALIVTLVTQFIGSIGTHIACGTVIIIFENLRINGTMRPGR